MNIYNMILSKIESIEYISEYILHVKYIDGIEGDVELSNLVDKGIFKILKVRDNFAKAYHTGYTIAWSDELQIDSDNIYMEISGKSFDDCFIKEKKIKQ